MPSARMPVDVSALNSDLAALLKTEYPAFSFSEMDRRVSCVLQAMEDAGADHAIIYGANRNGSAVPWLCNWPVTAEAALLLRADGHMQLFVQYYNHLPLAKRITWRADVQWGGAQTLATVRDALKDANASRVAAIGPVPVAFWTMLSEEFGPPVSLDKAYTNMRLIKSAEELEWIALGCWFSDRAITAMTGGMRPGVTGHDLADMVERAYVPLGGTTHIHYFSVTAMDAPELPVPAQFTSPKLVAEGDCVVTEISAAFWGYPGQVLRTFAVGTSPTSLYRELHAVAEKTEDAIVSILHPGATAQDVVDAAGIVEDAGFTACDDILHGFCGGYFPPVLGAPSRPAGPVPDFTFAENMTVVVQPNIITKDEKAGVQTGNLYRITADGAECMHKAPRGLLRV